MAATPQSSQKMEKIQHRARAEYRCETALHHLSEVPFDELTQEEISRLLEIESELRKLTSSVSPQILPTK